MALSGCQNENSEVPYKEAPQASNPTAKSIEVIGQPSFNLTVTNQCSLVLQMPKVTFTRGEAIPFALIFRNRET